jgi:hypothetical protein
MGTQHGHAAWASSIGMLYGYAARTCNKDMQHGHATWRYAYAVWTSSMETWTYSIDINMQHGHRLATRA